MIFSLRSCYQEYGLILKFDILQLFLSIRLKAINDYKLIPDGRERNSAAKGAYNAGNDITIRFLELCLSWLSAEIFSLAATVQRLYKFIDWVGRLVFGEQICGCWTPKYDLISLRPQNTPEATGHTDILIAKIGHAVRTGRRVNKLEEKI